MSTIPNSAMPHAGPAENNEEGGETLTMARRAADLAQRAVDLARDNPKTAIAAGAALAAGRVPEARPLIEEAAALLGRRAAATPADWAAIADLARRAGLDEPRLQVDLARDGPAIDAQLARHASQAWSLGLQGTPAYLVGPYLVEGRMGHAALKRTLAKARAQ